MAVESVPFKSRTLERATWRRQVLLWLALGMFGLATATIVLFVLQPFGAIGVHALGGGFEVASAGLGLWLAGIVLLWTLRQRRFELFDVMIWLSLNTYVQIIVNVWLLQRDKGPEAPVSFLISTDYQSLAMQAVLVFGVGLTVMWGAYALGVQWLSRRPAQKNEREHVLQLRPAAAIWTLGWLLTSLSVLVGIVGYQPAIAGVSFLNYLDFVSLITNCAQVSLMMYHFQNPTRRGWVWLVLVVGSSMFISLIAATKGAALILIQVMMAYFYSRRTIAWRPIILLGALTLGALIVLVPTANTVRRVLLVEQNLGFDTRVTAVTDALSSVDLEANSNETLLVFQGRQGSLLLTTAAILYLHPQIMPYVGLDVIEALPSALIPRFLWPGKGFVNIDAYQTTELYRDAGSSTGGGTAIGLFADSYRWGGWATMPFILAAFGFLGAWMYHQGPARRDPAGIVFYIAFGLSLLAFESTVFKIFMDMIQKGILLWVMTMSFLYRSVSRPSVSHK